MRFSVAETVLLILAIVLIGAAVGAGRVVLEYRGDDPSTEYRREASALEVVRGEPLDGHRAYPGEVAAAHASFVASTWVGAGIGLGVGVVGLYLFDERGAPRVLARVRERAREAQIARSLAAQERAREEAVRREEEARARAEAEARARVEARERREEEARVREEDRQRSEERRRGVVPAQRVVESAPQPPAPVPVAQPPVAWYPAAAAPQTVYVGPDFWTIAVAVMVGIIMATFVTTLLFALFFASLFKGAF